MLKPQRDPSLLTLNERVNIATKHLLWVASQQPPGWFVIRAFASQGGSQSLKLVSTKYFENSHPDFVNRLKHHLRYCLNKPWHTFYGINAFKIAEAKATHVISSRIAQVDADNVKLPARGPEPTRIVQTSAGNYQFLYQLDDALDRHGIEAVSGYLTNLVGGDKGGHSSAKLLRVPGSYNVKPAYSPPPLVNVIGSSGPVHSTIELFEQARAAGPSANSRVSAERRGPQETIPSPDVVRKKYSRKLPQDVRLRLRQTRPYESFTLRLGGRDYVVPKDDRSAIIFQIGCAFRDAGATPEETLSVIQASAFWRDREAEGRHENPGKLIEKIFATTAIIQTREDNGLVALDPADWAGKPVPERPWLVDGMIPMRKVTGLYGDGGTGKTTLTLQLAIDVALARDFLETPTKAGKVFAFLGEDEEQDAHIALATLCHRYGIGLDELRGRMLIAPRAAADNVLMTFNAGRPALTPLFDELLKKLKAFKPALIMVDTAADTFGGNENVRSEVRAFVANCCGRLARETGAAVVLLAHPSQAGLTSERGDGGSTAWNNSMRSRLSFFFDKDGDDDDRVLELKKANFGRKGTSLKLRWQDGAFALSESAKKRRSLTPGELEIIAEVERSFRMREPWSAHPQAKHRWLGKWIMHTLGAKRARAKSLLETLLFRGKIVEVDYDRHLHRKALCTPEQSRNFAREGAAMKRNDGA